MMVGGDLWMKLVIGEDVLRGPLTRGMAKGLVGAHGICQFEAVGDQDGPVVSESIHAIGDCLMFRLFMSLDEPEIHICAT